jgi:hypothetical protein
MRFVPERAVVEVRHFKWPRRPTSLAAARVLGEDEFGRWLGVAAGDPWWNVDRSPAGVFVAPLVKLVPSGTFWTACFHPADPVVDVDIVLPVEWVDGALEEVDLELDVLRSADGTVRVRDRDAFDRVRAAHAMPTDVAARAEETCERVRDLVERAVEPFGDVGPAWLARFLAGAAGARPRHRGR